MVEDFLSQRFHTHALLPSIYYLPTYSLQSSYSYTTCFVSNRIAGNLNSAFHNSEFSIRSGIVLLLDDAWRIMPCRNLIQGIPRWIWGNFCFSFFLCQAFFPAHFFNIFKWLRKWLGHQNRCHSRFLKCTWSILNTLYLAMLLVNPLDTCIFFIFERQFRP